MSIFPPGLRTRTAALAVLAGVLAATACGSILVQLASPGLPAASGRDALDGDLGDRVVTVADTDEPAVSHLDPQLLAALREATRDAAEDGIAIRINSGWRSSAYQIRLLEEAVEKYGSLQEARRWVSTPDESAHVTGDAVDVGPTDAAYWMSRYGSDYGLCQTFANEIWHYQLTVRPGGTCPPSRPDGAS